MAGLWPWLARSGITVVSGLARGIDAVAHRAALEAGGRTIAVLGCGIDRVYPAEHRKLAEEIIVHGALITADYAAEQGRDVFAVPGSVLMRGSAGTNVLI